jgi:hypothetical protein
MGVHHKVVVETFSLLAISFSETLMITIFTISF